MEDDTCDRLSPVDTHIKESRTETPDETKENLLQGSGNELNEDLPVNENTTSEETVVKKKKKKKKKTKQNKTAPMEGDDHELPPLPAWGTPPCTLNGLPASAGLSPRRLEPLGSSRLPGTVLQMNVQLSWLTVEKSLKICQILETFFKMKRRKQRINYLVYLVGLIIELLCLGRVLNILISKFLLFIYLFIYLLLCFLVLKRCLCDPEKVPCA